MISAVKLSDLCGQSVRRRAAYSFMENGLETELEDQLGYGRYDYKNKDTDNSRNGHSSKTLRTSFGDVEVSVPRDRKSEFDPIILKKNQTSISQEIEAKIISMYSKGMTTGDIEAHVRDIYGVEISDTTISRITDKILPKAKEWQQRPLEAIYAVVFLDAIHYHVRSEGQIVKKAVYIAIGIDLDGRKDVLGMWIGENESAKFWATVLNSLKNRGVEDIFIACTDNLNGFSAAIEAVYPKTEIQNCATVAHSVTALRSRGALTGWDWLVQWPWRGARSCSTHSAPSPQLLNQPGPDCQGQWPAMQSSSGKRIRGFCIPAPDGGARCYTAECIR